MTQSFHFAAQTRDFLLKRFELISLLNAYLATLVNQRSQLFAQVEDGAARFIVGERVGGCGA